jgi:hypothetical protein
MPGAGGDGTDDGEGDTEEEGPGEKADGAHVVTPENAAPRLRGKRR